MKLSDGSMTASPVQMSSVVWREGKPSVCDYYLVTVKGGTRLFVSELWFNPSIGGRWWAGRPYLNEYMHHPKPLAFRPIENVVAWAPMPTPFKKEG